VGDLLNRVRSALYSNVNASHSLEPPAGAPPTAAPDVPASSLRHDPFHLSPHIYVRSWHALWSSAWPSLRFLAQTEVHVYSFAVAANVLLSFFPFLVAMVLLCRWVFHWNAAVQVIFNAVKEYFPAGFNVDFQYYLTQATTQRKFSWLSVFLLLFTANGIFVPLEVAFNRIWRVKQNRSFIRNQAISLGLIFACGALVLTSICVTTLNVQFLKQHAGTSEVAAALQAAMFKITAVPISMLLIFSVYWVLPNARIQVKRLIPASIVVGALLELSKYLNVLTWPYLSSKLRSEVPPFVQSISIILWSFVATMIVLAGAEWSARVTVERLDDGSETSNPNVDFRLPPDGQATPR
jgi:membrane protein